MPGGPKSVASARNSVMSGSGTTMTQTTITSHKRFRHKTDGDQNGLLFFIGTGNRTAAYQNPVDMTGGNDSNSDKDVMPLKVTSYNDQCKQDKPKSGIQCFIEHPSSRKVINCRTNDESHPSVDHYFEVDLGPSRALLVNRYSLKQCGDKVLKDGTVRKLTTAWVLEGQHSAAPPLQDDGDMASPFAPVSAEGDWVILHEHKHDDPEDQTPKPGGFMSWPIHMEMHEDEDGFMLPFSKFRIRMTGERAVDLPLTLHALELYGKLEDTIEINPLEIDSREVGRKQEFLDDLRNEFNDRKNELDRKVAEREYKEDLWADFLIMKQNEEALQKQTEEEARQELYNAWKSIRKDKEDLARKEKEAKHRYNEALIQTKRDEKRSQQRINKEVEDEEIRHYKESTHEFVKEHQEQVKQERKTFLNSEKERMMDKKAEKQRIQDLKRKDLDTRWEKACWQRKVAEAEEARSRDLRSEQMQQFNDISMANLDDIDMDREERIAQAEKERQARPQSDLPFQDKPYRRASFERVPATPTQAAARALEKSQDESVSSPAARQGRGSLIQRLTKTFSGRSASVSPRSAKASPKSSRGTAAALETSGGSGVKKTNIHSKSQIKELDTITMLKREFCIEKAAAGVAGYSNPDGSVIDPRDMPKDDLIFWTDLNAQWSDKRDKQALMAEDRTYHAINYFDQKRDRVATAERMKAEDHLFLEEVREKWIKERREKEEERQAETARKKEFNADNLRSNRDLKMAQKAMAKDMENAEIEHYIKGRHAFTKEQKKTRKEFLNEVLRERQERVRVLRENKKRSKSLKEGERDEKWWRNDQRAKMRDTFDDDVLQERKARIAAQREQRAASPRRALMSPRLSPSTPRYRPGRSASPSMYALEMQAKQQQKEAALSRSQSLLSPSGRSPTSARGRSRTPTTRSPTQPRRL